MTVTSAISTLYVYKELADVELATKEMVSSAKRVSAVGNNIARFTSFSLNVNSAIY